MNTDIKDKLIAEGLEKIEKYLHIPVWQKIRFLKADKSDKSRVKADNGKVFIDYNSISDFYAALGVALSAEENTDIIIERKIKNVGIMTDCARNAVLHFGQAKKLIALSALLGYNYFELYLEDCFEVNDEPLFGYMRGRYTKDQLKELDAFSKKFGVELVPCIQTLAHLERIFIHQKEYAEKIQDKGDVLLVGEERTYRLIENMIATCRECFSSKKINVGMDEAFDLGQGRYFDLHGFVPKNKIIREHLEKVQKICKKYGFVPSMWADMFYDNLSKGEYDKVTKDANIIFWEYWNSDKKYYDDMFDRLDKSGAKYSFAGGAIKWSGFAPHNKLSETCIKVQFESAVEHNVRDYLLTTWGDDGAEAAHFSVLPCLCYFAMLNLGLDEGYLQNVCKIISGYTHEEFCALDLPNEPRRMEKILTNPCKYLFYEDVFLGGTEYFSQPDYPQGFAKNAEELTSAAAKKSDYSYLFSTMAKLCEFLSVKCQLSWRIYSAYREKDKKALKKIIGEIKKSLRLLDDFIAAWEAQWDKESRAFGKEVLQIRFSGVRARLAYALKTLKKYISGEIGHVEELEEEKIFSVHPDVKDDSYGGTCFGLYNQNVTFGKL